MLRFFSYVHTNFASYDSNRVRSNSGATSIANDRSKQNILSSLKTALEERRTPRRLDWTEKLKEGNRTLQDAATVDAGTRSLPVSVSFSEDMYTPIGRRLLNLEDFTTSLMQLKRHRLTKLEREQDAEYLARHNVRVNAYYDLFAHVISSTAIPEGGLHLEFGVAKGNSANISGAILQNKSPNSTYWGFDTFTGLPQGWKGHMRKGTFAQPGGRPPPVKKNVHLVKGLFSDTLPGFLEEHPTDTVSFVNIDCDLYRGTLEVLRNLAPRFQIGTILHFHELFHIEKRKNRNGTNKMKKEKDRKPRNPSEEMRALYDFLNERNGTVMLEYLKLRATSPEPAVLRVARSGVRE